MRNLIWDLAVIVRDAFEAGRTDTADFENYNPPVKQFQRVESALQAINGTSVVIQPPSFSPELARAMEAAWDHANLPLMHETISPLKDFEKNGYAVQTLEKLGYRWEGGRWIEPGVDAKPGSAIVRLESLGFKYDPGCVDPWQPPKSCTFAGMLDALLQIVEWSKERHDVSRQGALDEIKTICNSAVHGVGKVNSYREQLRKIREACNRVENNPDSSYRVIRHAIGEIEKLAAD